MQFIVCCNLRINTSKVSIYDQSSLLRLFDWSQQLLGVLKPFQYFNPGFRTPSSHIWTTDASEMSRGKNPLQPLTGVIISEQPSLCKLACKILQRDINTLQSVFLFLNNLHFFPLNTDNDCTDVHWFQMFIFR